MERKSFSVKDKGWWIDEKGNVLDLGNKSHFEWLKKTYPEFQKINTEMELVEALGQKIYNGWIRVRNRYNELNILTPDFRRNTLDKVDNFITNYNIKFDSMVVESVRSTESKWVRPEDYSENNFNLFKSVNDHSSKIRAQKLDNELQNIKSKLETVAIRNEDIIKMFLTDDFPHNKEEGAQRGIKRWQPQYGTQNLYLGQRGGNWCLINYNTPILVRDKSGQVHFNQNKYSMTTSTIQNKIKKMAEGMGIQLIPFTYNESNPNPFEFQDDQYTYENQEKNLDQEENDMGYQAGLNKIKAQLKILAGQ